jgi:predicted amidohydrolase
MPDAPPTTTGTLRVCLTQLSPGGDVKANLAAVLDLVAKAGPGADLLLLPENCLLIGTNAEMRAGAVTLDGPEITALRKAAADAGTVVILGGVKHVRPDGSVRNTAVVIDDHGGLVGGYDKVHLFDAQVGGRTYAASEVETAGDHGVVVELKGVRIGLTICFDVRFPELHRRLARAGAEVLLVPAAFVVATGRAHWEVLLRARAIENGAFVVASATVGDAASSSFPTYGHALVVDPWGTVLTDLEEEAPAWQVLELDLARVHEARAALPVLAATRQDAYDAPVETMLVAGSAQEEMRSA